MFWALDLHAADHRRALARRDRHELAGAQDPGAHADSPRPHARGPARIAAALRRRPEAADQRRHHPRRSRQGGLLDRARRCSDDGVHDVPGRALRAALTP